MPARTVRLIHWNAAEAEERTARLRAAGYPVNSKSLTESGGLRELRENPPLAVVIDLSRLPMQGRDVGLAVRSFKSTRCAPIVFVEGDPEKVARIQSLLPDAVFTTWPRIRAALKDAIAHPPAEPVRPKSLLAGYSGTPLPKKLGIKANSVVVLVDAPEGFEKTLGELPEGAVLERSGRGRRDLTIWFVRSRKNLLGRIERIAGRLDRGGLWIAWPKKGSGLAGDVTQNEVRGAGLAAGLVDYKICAIDATWSGLLFSGAKRQKAKGKNQKAKG